MDLSDAPPSRRRVLGFLSAAPAWPGVAAAQAETVSVTQRGARGGRIGEAQIIPFETSPFPYDGEVPGQGKPFLDVTSAGRRGHTSPRGGVYWADKAYSDRSSLLFIPRGFDPSKPALMVVYMHGNQATLARDVRGRQQVPRQIEGSGLNAVLVAPQFGSDVLDSSAGRFWQPGVFDQYLDEAAGRLAELYGDASARSAFGAMPVVIVAYSGGYQPAAYALQVGGVGSRVRGVLLLDALYAETEMFADWVVRHAGTAFFVSAYSASTRTENERLQVLLGGRGVPFQIGLPAVLRPGTVAFQPVSGSVSHNDFVTRAWVGDPLKALLARASGYARSISASRR